jgi:tetratricopeptide (TPR) repeat protein
MDTVLPVFRNEFDIHLWKKLDEAEAGTKRLLSKPVTVQSVVDEILEHPGAIHSSVLVRTIRLAQSKDMPYYRLGIPKLVNRRSINDYAPAIAAADVFLSIDDVESAKSMIECIPDCKDLRAYNTMVGRILLKEGDNTGAKAALMCAFRADPGYMEVYTPLHQADPNGGWMYRRNIELVRRGEVPLPYGGNLQETYAEKLYGIYWNWYNGNRDNVPKALMGSKEYAQKNPEYIIAAGRMAAEDEDWDSAIPFYKDTLKLIPSYGYVISEAAEVYRRSGDPLMAVSLIEAAACPMQREEALECLMRSFSDMGDRGRERDTVRKLLELETVGAPLYYACIDICIADQLYDEARYAVKALVATYPSDAEAHKRDAEIDMRTNHPADAQKAASEAIRLDPKDADARFIRGRAHFAQGHNDPAIKDLSTAYKLDPGHVEALRVLKEVYKGLRDFSNTIDTCDKIVTIDPRDAATMIDMGVAMDSLGEPGSMDVYRKALSTDRSPQTFVNVISMLAGSGRYEDTLALCDEYRAHQKYALVNRIAGNAHYALGRYDEASRSYGLSLTQANDPKVWNSKGMADEKRGDLNAAWSAFTKAAAMDPNDPEYRLSLASVKERKNDMKGAIAHLDAAIDLDPRCGYAWNRKGHIFQGMGDNEKALDSFTRACDLNPRDRDSLAGRLDVCLSMGDNAKIIEACDSMLDKYPDDTKSIIAEFHAYTAMGRSDEAREYIDNVYYSNSRSVPALMARKQIMWELGEVNAEIEACRRILQFKEDQDVRADLDAAMARAGLSLQGSRSAGSDQCQNAGYKRAMTGAISDTSELRSIAEQLCSEKEYVAAVQIGALIVAKAPASIKSYVSKMEIHLMAQDRVGAMATLDDALSKFPRNGTLLELQGDLHSSNGDHAKALSSYEASIVSGREISSIYIKRGREQEHLGQMEAAANSYSLASIRDPKDPAIHLRLAELYESLGRDPAAERSYDSAISLSPNDAKVLLAKAKYCDRRKDTRSLLFLYEKMLMSDSTPGQRSEFSAILRRTGLTAEAKVIESLDPGQVGTGPKGLPQPPAMFRKPVVTGSAIRRTAERVLKHAYNTGMALNDPGLGSGLDIPDAMMEKVMEYLSDIEEYGDIVPFTPAYERLEVLSRDAILNARITDIDNNTVLSIPCAYMASGAEDADEAKTVIAYTHRALTCIVDESKMSAKDETMAKEVAAAGGMTMYQIINSYKVGPYEAKAIKELSLKPQ